MPALPSLAPYLPSVRELAQLIDLAGGFVLVPVEITGPDLGRALAEWLTDHDHPALVVEPRDDAAWEALAPALLALRPAPTGVVLVIGGAKPPQGVYAGLRLLNQRRDSVVRHLGCPLLWCGPHEFLELTWERAPDFWSIRSVDRRLEAAIVEGVGAEPAEGQGPLRALYEAARQQGDARNAARLAVRLADALIGDGNTDAARALLDEALGKSDAETAPELLLRRARVERIRGEMAAATLTLTEVVRCGVGRLRAEGYVEIGEMLASTGSTARAEQAYRDALHEATAAGDRRSEGRALLRLGVLTARGGRGRAAAMDLIERARVIASETGDGELLHEVGGASSETAANLHDSGSLEMLLDAQPGAPGASRVPPVDLPAELVEAYRAGNLVVVAGPGVSAAAGIPTGAALLRRMVEALRSRNAPTLVIHEIEHLVLHNRFDTAFSAAWAALGADAAALVAHVLSDEGRKVPEIAFAIAALEPRLRAVLTPNLDHLLERAFRGRWQMLPRATSDLAQRRRFILKLRGTLLDRSTWVLGDETMAQARQPDPAADFGIVTLLRTSVVLFVDSLFGDDDFDALAEIVSQQHPATWYLLAKRDGVGPYRRAHMEAKGLRFVTVSDDSDAPRLLRALATAPPPPSSVPSAAPPLPSAPYDAAWYIHRRVEERVALQGLTQPGAPLLLFGPHLVGKNTLLTFLLDTMRSDDSTRVARIDFREITGSTPNQDDYVAALGRALGEAIGMSFPTDGHGSSLRRLDRFLEDRVLPRIEGRLILALEAIETITAHPFALSILRMLRSWTARMTKPEWSTLRMVLTSSVTPWHLEPRDNFGSPVMNSYHSLHLNDFEPEQVSALAALHGLPFPLDVAARVSALVGGQPYLLRTLMHAAVTRRVSLPALLDDSRALSDLFADHLGHLAAQIQQGGLEGAVRALLASPPGEPGRDAVERLYSLGVVVPDRNGDYRVRYALYDEYLRACLRP